MGQSDFIGAHFKLVITYVLVIQSFRDVSYTTYIYLNTITAQLCIDKLWIHKYTTFPLGGRAAPDYPKFLYTAVSSPARLLKALHTLLHVQSNTISTWIPGMHSAMVQLMREGCSYKQIPLSVAKYSFIHWVNWSNVEWKKLSIVLTPQHRIRTQCDGLERQPVQNVALFVWFQRKWWPGKLCVASSCDWLLVLSTGGNRCYKWRGTFSNWLCIFSEVSLCHDRWPVDNSP